MSTGKGAPPADESTFLFADIAGFTALTEAMGDEQAADLAGDFKKAVDESLPEGGEHIKTIGDALMLRVAEPVDAVRLGLVIVHEVAAQHEFPMVRIGMHHGPAVERDGDWFGASVNLAARVSGLASGGEVLLTGSTRAAAGDLDGVHFHEHGRHNLRNVTEPVLVFSALREGEPADHGFVLDPVCRMALDPNRSTGRLSHEGIEYHFCSRECLTRFATAPEVYIQGD